MKKKTVSLLLSLCLTALLSNTIHATDDTPTSGYKWSSNNITYQNDGTNNSYREIWNTGAEEWNDVTVVTLSSGTNSNFTVGNKTVEHANWDGVFEPTYNYYDMTIESAKLWVNDHYTSQYLYWSTENAIQSVATHELGHALGLLHAPERTFSVMVPATFFSDGSFARVQYFPGIGDENSVNNIYSNTFSSLQHNVEESDFVEGKNLVPLDFSWSVWYLNLKDLARDADLVVKADVVANEGTVIMGENYFDYKNKSQIYIQEVLKGDVALSNQTISLYQTGGEDENTVVKYHGSTLLNKNDHVILYLKEIGKDEYIPINEDVSIYRWDADMGFVNLHSQQLLSEEQIVELSAF